MKNTYFYFGELFHKASREKDLVLALICAGHNAARLLGRIVGIATCASQAEIDLYIQKRREEISRFGRFPSESLSRSLTDRSYGDFMAYCIAELGLGYRVA